MRALIIVDLQNDFVQPDGALYFTGADKVIAPVIDLAKKTTENFQIIITTQDWHEPDDEEFSIWPKHCVKNTYGAEIVEPLKKLLQTYSKHITIHKTRYSAFHGTNLEQLIKDYSINEVEICGVVTHICVLFTAEELRNRGIKVTVHEQATASYDLELHRFAIRMMKEVLGAEVVP